MLRDPLFKIILLDQQENRLYATLEINKNSEIFNGHFPGQPVLPGACMLQIVKDVLENALNMSFRLKKADQMKFLGIIDPEINNIVHLQLSHRSLGNNLVHVTGDLLAQNEICFKFRGSFISR